MLIYAHRDERPHVFKAQKQVNFTLARRTCKFQASLGALNMHGVMAEIFAASPPNNWLFCSSFALNIGENCKVLLQGGIK
jgi:hypothetical protein